MQKLAVKTAPTGSGGAVAFVGAVSTAMFLSQDADQPLAAVQNLRGRALRA